MAYNPQLHILASDAIAFSNGTPGDARGKFYDEINLRYRPYVTTLEVLAELVTEDDRSGQFLIVINTGGVLQPNGDVVGGTNAIWAFLNGTADSDLVVLFEDSTTGGLITVPDYASLPTPGEIETIYLTLDTASLYYWDGAAYVEISGPQTYIQNQSAVAQAGDFRINGTGQVAKLATTSEANLILYGNSTDNNILGRTVFGRHIPNGYSGLLIVNAANAGGNNPLTVINDVAFLFMVRPDGVAVVNNRLYLGGQVNTAGLGDIIGYNQAGTEMQIMAQNIPLRLQDFGPNYGNQPVIIGNEPNNGAKLQIASGALSLASSATDYGSLNGALFFRPDLMKFRGGANGVWKNLTFEDTAYVTSYSISVDQDNPQATDARAGLNKYSQSVPFKTIQAALGAATNGDIICVHHSLSPYVGDIVMDPNGYNVPWTYATFWFDGVTIDGNFTTQNVNFQQVNFIGTSGFNSQINGSVTGLYTLTMGYVVNVNIRDGLYGSATPAVISNSKITWLNPVLSPIGLISDSELNFNAGWTLYSMSGSCKYTNCQVNFGGSMYAGAGGIFNAGSLDLQFENCRIKLGGHITDEARFPDCRILLRNSRISFVGFLTTEPVGVYYPVKLIAHNTQFIAANAATDVINAGAAGTVPQNHIELMGTIRNCGIGTLASIAGNDIQVPNITEF